jgi:hypothetical protein
MLAAAALGLAGEILVEFEEHFVQAGIEEQLVAQGRPPSAFACERRGTLSWA